MPPHHSSSVRRPVFRAATSALLLGIAAVGVAYPVWWDHRSSSASHALLHSALGTSGIVSGHTGAAVTCRSTLGPSTARSTGGQPGVLAIPSIGLIAPVLEGLGNPVLDVAVGHDPATVWPGAKGESLLLAHDVSYFSGLDKVRLGATVIWTLGCERAVFRVVTTLVTRPGATIAVPFSGSGLALITCWPTNALFWTPERYVVETELVSHEWLAHPTAALATPVAPLRVPAPPALVADGLSLLQSRILVGHLEIAGSPSASFREGPEPLSVGRAALREYAAAFKTAAAGRRSWWSALAVAGVPLPAPWSLAYDTNVTLVVRGSTVEGVLLSSPAVTVTLTVHDGALFVAHVSPRNSSP